MTVSTLTAIEMTVAVALVTLFTRAVPFLFFGGKRGVPKIIGYLGKVLPSAIVAAIVVFCLKDVDFANTPYGAPYLLAIVVTVMLHKAFKQTLISILGGTVTFMVLSRVIFV